MQSAPVEVAAAPPPEDDLLNSLTVTAARIVAPGAQCPTGGIQVDNGIDDNSNGLLDDEEIDNSQVLCNGLNGTDGQNGGNGLDGADGLNGTNGTNGTDGIDGVNGDNGTNGTNGSNGANGANGSDGLNSLIDMSDEPSGSNCEFGGTRIEAGIDNNGDSVLQAAEVTDTQFLCALSSSEFDGLVFMADANSDGMFELFRTARDSNSVSKLAGPKPILGDIQSFKVSPDRSQVAFVGDLDTNDINELYVASLLDGLPPVKVSGVLVTGGNVSNGSSIGDSFQWSPDSSRIAYLAVQDTDAVFELYSVIADGAGNSKVSGLLVPGGEISRFQWSSDSRRIAYQAAQDTDNVFELYTVLADGADNTKVSGPMVTGGNVDSFSW